MSRSPASDNLKGAGLMIAAMAGFAIEDVFLKSAARSFPVGLVLMLFGAGGTLLFALLARIARQGLWHPDMASRPMILRAASEMLGRLGYTMAIALMPLSTVSAILQATPLVVVAGAALIFHEKVGWRRWLAIAVGLSGVMLILRPGGEGLGPVAIFALLGMAGFAGRDLATRASPRSLSNWQLGLCGFAVLVPTGALLLATGIGGRLGAGSGAVAPALGFIAIATVVGVAGYSALTQAMRTGEVSVVTPFRYTRLLFGVLLGMAIFGESPGLPVYLGSALILGAGLYSLWRETRRRPPPVQSA
ncbi:DMT family transporter [Fluviibacterium sp. S390]|uniref:DMT family transporter n=1 Tax=Fluviibacterium sp. S390 TaxID=3415139 RepID=UPI003C797628